MPVDVNTAAEEELIALTGIGREIADAVVRARPFASIDDLLSVPGIGKATLKRLNGQGVTVLQGQQEESAGLGVPPEIYTRFEPTGGVPVDLVTELFALLKMPEHTQSAFWEAAVRRDEVCITGEVQSVKTRRDGTTQVGIGVERGTNYPYHPANLTQAQLDEMKRAQSARLCVTVCWEHEVGVGRVVTSVVVHECD